jgi:hypothetical protein
MVRNQMLCIVAPVSADHAGQAAHDLDAKNTANLRAGCEALFEDLGFVHFACLAVLPPAGKTPSLLLELAIDPGIGADAVVDALVQKGAPLLGRLFDVPADTGALRTWLSTHLSRADGGYIGVRDRSVSQVRAEAKLFVAVRTAVASARGRMSQQQEPPTSRGLAHAAREVVNQPEHAFAATPSPRSFWRSPDLSTAVRVGLILLRLVLPALLALVVLAGVLATIGTAAIAAGSLVIGRDMVLGAAVFHPFESYAVAALRCVLIALGTLYLLTAALRAGVMPIATGLLLVLGVVFLFFAAPLVSPDSGDYLTDLGRFGGAIGILAVWGFGVLVYVAVVAVVAVAAVALALMVVPAHLGLPVLVPAIGVLLAAEALGWIMLLGWLAQGHLGVSTHIGALAALGRAGPWAPAAVLLLLSAFVVVAAIVLRLVWNGLSRAGKRVERFNKVTLGETPAVQQTHDAIEACEASLVGKVGHMISVTDVRSRLHGWALRLLMRFIMFLGESWFTESRLGNAEGIKFGHWHVIDGGRRLVFCSNFDGEFGAYLDEFILGASDGINLTWRWTELRARPPATAGQPGVARARRFPPTRLFAFGGCKHEQWFKAYARDSMVPHLFRYEAYPYSNQDITRATRLRDALATPSPDLVQDDRIMRAAES